MKIESREGFSVGGRVRRKSDGREGVVTSIQGIKAVKGAADFVLKVKLDGNVSPSVGNAAFFECVE